MAQLENFRLKVFRAVAQQLNFRKAAEHLFLTQPAVTLQIKAQENDLGVRLFDRTAGKISLTRQGSVFARLRQQTGRARSRSRARAYGRRWQSFRRTGPGSLHNHRTVRYSVAAQSFSGRESPCAGVVA